MYIKKSGINNLKILFYFIDFYITFYLYSIFDLSHKSKQPIWSWRFVMAPHGLCILGFFWYYVYDCELNLWLHKSSSLCIFLQYLSG